MLAKPFRLTKRDMDRLYKKGANLRQDFIFARVLANRTDHCRFAVVISKKVLAQATDRNRLRRLIYQDLARLKAKWQNQHLDLALNIKTAPAEKEIGWTLERLFEKINS